MSDEVRVGAVMYMQKTLALVARPLRIALQAEPWFAPNEASGTNP